jgi:integrase
MGKVNNARVRYCDDETLAKIYQACPTWLQPIVMLARYTGLRRENVVCLQWEQVDLARGLIILEHTKNGDRLGIPLCDPALKTLETVRPSRPLASGPVFLQHTEDREPVTPDMVTTAFRRACEVGRRDELSLSRPAAYLRLRARAEGRGSLSGATVARSPRWTDDATVCASSAGEFARSGAGV